jgi:hypothetical protein
VRSPFLIIWLKIAYNSGVRKSKLAEVGGRSSLLVKRIDQGKGTMEWRFYREQ